MSSFLNRFCLVVLLALAVAAAGELELHWKLNDPGKRTAAFEPLAVSGETVTFRTGKEYIPCYNDKAIPVKTGQQVAITAVIAGKGKAWIGISGYADAGYKHCDKADWDTSFVAGASKKRTFRFKVADPAVRYVRLKIVSSPDCEYTLSGLKVTVAEAVKPPPGVTVISPAGWVLNNTDLKETGVEHLEPGDTDITLRSGQKGIDFYHPGAVPVKPGQLVTITAAVSGKGKAWIGFNAYKDLAYTHCSEASADVSFTPASRPLKRTFKFMLKGTEVRSVRPHIILAENSDITFDEMRFQVSNPEAHPPLNPLIPEALLFPGPVTMARWIWSPCDIRYSYWRTVKMQDAFFRMRFKVKKAVKHAELMAGFRLPGEVFLNGQKLERIPFEQKPNALRGEKFDMTPAVKTGGNLLAVEIINKTDDKSCGLIFLGKLEYEDGTVDWIASSAKAVKAVKDLPPAGWKELNFNDSKWTAAMEMGDASTGRWMKMGDTMTLFATPEEQQAYQAGLEAAKKLSPALEAKLAAEPEPQASISWTNGLPMIRINDEEILPIRRIGLAFTAPYDGYDFVYKSRDFGLDLYDLGMTDYHEPLSFWPADGVFDYRAFDLQAAKLLSLNPKARFIISIGFGSMLRWCRNHPEEVMAYAAGPTEPYGEELTGRPLKPSPASRLFREEIKASVRALAEYLKTRPWGKRVAAVKISYGTYAEWQIYGSNFGMPDTGKAMTRAFREYLRQLYGTDEALRQAWHKPDAAIDTALPPTKEERYGDNHFLRDPAKYKFVQDFYDCMQHEMADMMIETASAVKEYLPGRLFGCYYSYQNMPRSPEGMKAMEEKILASGKVDFFCAPNDYNNETRSAGGTGMTRIRTSILQRFGKLGLLEADIRTHIAETGEPSITLKTPEESISVIRRDFCNTIFDRGGLQLHQFGGDGPYRGGPDWYNSPEILKEIKQNMAIQRRVRKIAGMDWKREIAVVSSYGEFVHHGYPVQDLLSNDYFVWWQIYGLYCSGYTFQYLDISDFFLSKDRYKIVVFLEPFTFTDAQRRELLARFRNSGTTVIWIYAPGFVTERGFSEPAMAELTGLPLKADFRKLPWQINREGADAFLVANPWKNNAPHCDSPRISCGNAPGVTVLGRYPDGSAGYVERDYEGFKSVFIGVPVRSGYQWAELFQRYGGHAYAAPRVIVRANSHLVMVHVGEPGVYKITLPEKAAKVVDLYDREKTVAENAREVELVADAPATWLLKVK